MHCQMMVSFVKLLIVCCQNNKESGCVVIYAGESFSALQTFASVICWYCIEVVLQAGCGKLDWNLYFPSCSAQRLHMLVSSTDKTCGSHPRLVDLSWPVHQQCSKTFSFGGSQLWGVGPGKSGVHEQDNTWPWPRHVSWLARNMLHCECKWRGWTPYRISYLEHWVTTLCSHFFGMQLTAELCCIISLVFW